jgi:hypothetical protein
MAFFLFIKRSVPSKIAPHQTQPCGILPTIKGAPYTIGTTALSGSALLRMMGVKEVTQDVPQVGGYAKGVAKSSLETCVFLWITVDGHQCAVQDGVVEGVLVVGIGISADGTGGVSPSYHYFLRKFPQIHPISLFGYFRRCFDPFFLSSQIVSKSVPLPPPEPNCGVRGHGNTGGSTYPKLCMRYSWSFQG